MTDDQNHYLASDRERQQVVDQLQSAVEEGRLTVSAFDERSKNAYAATTHTELARLTSDLPATDENTRQVQRDSRSDRHNWLVQRRGVLGMSAFMILLWGVSCLATGSLIFFWPILPIGLGGIGLAVRSASRRREGRQDS